MAARSTNDRWAIVVCYYYHPSGEVASRRLSALTACLRDCGYQALVVSTFAGQQPLSLPDDAVPLFVAEPSRPLIQFLVWLKRGVVGLWRALTKQYAPAASGKPASSAARSVPTPLTSPIVGSLLRLLYALDPYKRWSLHAGRAARRAMEGKNVRLILCSGPHFTAMYPAWRLSKHFRAPLIADFRDPMFAGGEGVLLQGWLSMRLRALLERHVVRDSALVISASPGIASALTSYYPNSAAKIYVVLNGFDGAATSPAIESHGQLNMLFAGFLYDNRNPFPLLEALNALASDPLVDRTRVSMTFVGECETYRGMHLPDWLSGKPAAELVRFVPEVSAAELKPFSDRATVLVNFAQGQARQIPAKTFEHLASGREILAFCEADSDTAKILQGIRGVIRITPGDTFALTEALRDLYQRHVLQGRLTTPDPSQTEKFSRNYQNKLFRELLQSYAT